MLQIDIKEKDKNGHVRKHQTNFFPPKMTIHFAGSLFNGHEHYKMNQNLFLVFKYFLTFPYFYTIYQPKTFQNMKFNFVVQMVFKDLYKKKNKNQNNVFSL